MNFNGNEQTFLVPCQAFLGIRQKFFNEFGDFDLPIFRTYW